MGPRRLLPWSGPGCLEPRGAGGAGVRRGDAGGHGHLRCSGTLSHGQGGGQPMTPVDILTLISGVLVGFTLGVIGGGGSILALPLPLSVVGMKDPRSEERRVGKGFGSTGESRCSPGH